MQCANQFTHTIQAGDTLYSLAIRYNTTVADLLELNPGVEIYNLQIGTGLIVCPGEGAVVPPVAPIPPIVTPKPPIGTVPTLPQKFRELLSMFVCWLAEQFGEDTARRIITSVYNDWQNGNFPC